MLVVLITGDRNWQMDNQAQAQTIETVIKSLHRTQKGKVLVVHGDARGVDSMADYYAKQYRLKRSPHPADWGKYHRAAGPIRNREMLEEKPALVIAFHDDLANSRGTKDMVRQSLRHGIKVMHIQSDGTSREVKEI